MSYVLFAIVGFIIFVGVVAFIKGGINFEAVLGLSLAIVISFSIVIFMDYKKQTDDIEIWSGKITEVIHEEEYDEWIPPSTETYTETDSKGNVSTHTRVIPGYTEHHYAENYITTTDKGKMSVNKVPNGKELDDDFVNSTEELKKYYPIGMPTASVHTFENKLKASYSIFKHKDINLEEYEGLPEYPTKVNEQLTVDRLIGNFKDKKNVSELLDELNSKLNDTNNPNNKEKIKSYKQVNMMFVNLGNKTEDYGYALQDYWKNGAKNDFIITFGTDSKGNILWCHPFSWTEVEILKSDVREYMIGKNTNNISESIKGVADLVENKFDRKQFAEFDYIQIDVSVASKNIMFLFFIASCVCYLLYYLENR